jgi:hypothetical protein
MLTFYDCPPHNSVTGLPVEPHRTLDHPLANKPGEGAYENSVCRKAIRLEVSNSAGTED